jgi:hypothetical protein
MLVFMLFNGCGESMEDASNRTVGEHIMYENVIGENLIVENIMEESYSE